jgi:cytochrome oxidase assembly protein ShyY1
VLRLLARPRWIALSLLVVGLIVLCVELGLWQLRRLDDRRAFNAAVTASVAADPVAIEQLPSGEADEWTVVRAAGRYDAEDELLVRNRTLDSTNGFYVVTPLVTEEDLRLLVLRGWVPAGSTARESPDVPAPPVGEVTISGRLRTSETARRTLAAEIPGQITALDTQGIGDLLGAPVYDQYVELTDQDPPADEEPRLLPAPEVSDGPHLAYAVQWFAFGVIAVGGWVVLLRRERSDERERGASASHLDRERSDERERGASASHSDHERSDEEASA